MLLGGLDVINKGALAEVVCGTELVAHTNPLLSAELFYWHREAKSSNAEVDYILQLGSKILPLEVKSGAKGKMRSMHVFLKEKGLPLGLRCSLDPLSKHENILTVPLYAIGEIARLVG